MHTPQLPPVVTMPVTVRGTNFPLSEPTAQRARARAMRMMLGHDRVARVNVAVEQAAPARFQATGEVGIAGASVVLASVIGRDAADACEMLLDRLEDLLRRCTRPARTGHMVASGR